MTIEESKRVFVKKLWVLAILVLAVFLAIFAVTFLGRIGKVKLTIYTSPKDNKIFINNKSSSPGVHYLKPGDYQIAAKRSGFSDDTTSVKLKNNSEEVYLLPAPQSDEARWWLQNNPEIQGQREAIASKRANKFSDKLEFSYPVVKYLPFSTLRDGPFRMDYGASGSHAGIFLEISNSSPEGRAGAIDWLYRHDQDPTDLEIRYLDYINPFADRGGQ